MDLSFEIALHFLVLLLIMKQEFDSNVMKIFYRDIQMKKVLRLIGFCNCFLFSDNV